MKTCELVRARLIEYVDGDLTPDEREVLEEHLTDCPECQEELMAYSGLRELLLDDGYEEPHPFFWTRFNARLRERLRAGSGVPGLGRFGGGLVPRLVPVGIAAVLILVGFWIGAGPHMTGTDAGTVADSGTQPYDPVVSAASKLSVESGQTGFAYADDTDTLRPATFATPTEGPRFMLARDAEPQSDIDKLLSEKNIRD